jgi:four helix bundle protein
MARGSACECESWIDLLVRLEYLPAEVRGGLIANCDELQRLLTLRMKSLDQDKSYAIRDGKADSYEV